MELCVLEIHMHNEKRDLEIIIISLFNGYGT